MNTDTVTAFDTPPIPVLPASIINVTEAAAGKIRELLSEDARPTAACAYSCRAAVVRASSTA